MTDQTYCFYSLMSEKNNLQKMKDMCSDAVENVDAETSDKDISRIKRSFLTVKADLVNFLIYLCYIILKIIKLIFMLNY